MNAREAAYTALLRYENNASYSNIELDGTIKKYALDGVERSFFTALFYGVIERSITLDYYISKLSERKLAEIDTDVLIMLRMGLYQLMYMDKVPESAAVNESVALARRFWAKKNSESFVNAVLRNYIRKKGEIALPDNKKHYIKHISVKYSMPEWLCVMFAKSYGKSRTESIFEAMNKVPPMTLRTNTLRLSREELMAKLCEAGIECRQTKNAAHGVKLRASTPYEALAKFEGDFFVQDEASQICTQVLGAKKGERVLDACACPGGKSFGIALEMENEGSVLSCDLHKNKLSLISRGASGLGIDIIETKERNGANEENESGMFDRILCDVPCSGLGVIAKKPDIRRKSPEDIERLPGIQAKILEESARHLKPGGTLVYSTCTLNPKENKEVVEAFLSSHEDFALVPFCIGEIECEGYTELFPHIHHTDGFFIAKMTRK